MKGFVDRGVFCSIVNPGLGLAVLGLREGAETVLDLRRDLSLEASFCRVAVVVGVGACGSVGVALLVVSACKLCTETSAFHACTSRSHHKACSSTVSSRAHISLNHRILYTVICAFCACRTPALHTLCRNISVFRVCRYQGHRMAHSSIFFSRAGIDQAHYHQEP